MKKILGVTAAVVLATGVAFAEDEGFKANVTVKTGLESNLTEKETYAVHSDGDFSRIDTVLKYTGTDYGVYTQFRQQWTPGTVLYKQKAELSLPTTEDKETKKKSINVDGKITNTTSLSNYAGTAWVRQAYGYANLFGGNAKVTSGLIYDTQWQDDYWGNSSKQGGGARLEITPKAVEGLNFGATFIARSASDDKATVNWDKQHWRAGVRYDDPSEVFTTLAGWDGGKNNDTEFAWVQFTLLKTPGFEALSVGGSVTVTNLVIKSTEERSEYAILNAELDVSKIAEALNLKVGVLGYGNFVQYGSDSKEDAYQEFEVEGYAEYKINDQFTVTADGSYWLSTKDDVDGEFWAKGKVAYKPAKKATIGVSYGYKSDNYAKVGYGGWTLTTSGAGADLAGNNFVGLDFNYSF